MGALAAYRWHRYHPFQIDTGDGVNGVDQRHRVGTTAMGSPGTEAHIGDVGRELDDHRQRAIRLAPARHHLYILRHLAPRRAHAALRHAVGAAEVQLDAIASRGFHQRQNEFPRFLFAGHHQRHDQRPIRPVFFDLGDFPQVDLQ